MRVCVQVDMQISTIFSSLFFPQFLSVFTWLALCHLAVVVTTHRLLSPPPPVIKGIKVAGSIREQASQELQPDILVDKLISILPGGSNDAN